MIMELDIVILEHRNHGWKTGSVMQLDNSSTSMLPLQFCPFLLKEGKLMDMNS
jgi:hypothetical protein